ncbi:type I-E CRISPR-associated endoribonuclease Cas2 [Jannaschia pagri]|uniref:Type I-E CRISPR-associated endoribonuclease Cas2 n=1 Tax=Jannaschia pagri TaxID=2829797 RepID=A0ABQ4NRQ1_9RHOB|nr:MULTISPECIES: type I-E CRISPR-associated endoribonuclease Cas2e [unclassified Jannaschia]GIT93240.1 type I-E CRISPR-associated endoribonuclease Cas2 [Jannaschia sp. AI_61]GIT97093.1 type I-E CRISPR-associated endoribonuclease Cas2 [Jannaschia sp. AI_62]
MPMTMVVTRDVEARYRGFLTSIMLEVAPGIYVAPDLSAGVRTRIWTVLSGWYDVLGRGAIVMVWRDPSATGALAMEMLGEPPKEIVDADGILLVKRK